MAYQCSICGKRCKNGLFGKGIYHGIFLDWFFPHCHGHTQQELQKAAEIYAEKQADNICVTNPFKDIKKLFHYK